MNLKPIVVSVVIASLVLFAGAYFGQYLSKKEMPAFVWMLIPFYAVITILLYRMITRAIQKTPTRFVTAVYASVLVKLLLSILIVGVYFFLQMQGKKALAVSVMGIYFVFTVVLIRALLPVVRSEDAPSS